MNKLFILTQRVSTPTVIHTVAEFCAAGLTDDALLTAVVYHFILNMGECTVTLINLESVPKTKEEAQEIGFSGIVLFIPEKIDTQILQDLHTKAWEFNYMLWINF